MVQKFFAVGLIVGAVIVMTLFAVVLMPFWATIVQTTNATISSHNQTAYDSARGVVLAWPLLMVFIPVLLGGVLVVRELTKRRGER